jgi:ABC-type lipoprotein release transport system permease subunit
MRPVFVGIVLGALGAWWLSRYTAALLYDVKPFDLATFGAVAAILLATALLACYLPGRRAMRIGPAVALRSE